MSIPAYTEKTWVDGASPAISAENLQIIDDQVQDISDEFTNELIRPITTKTSIVDADEVGGNDSANSFKWKKWTWATVKAWVKTFSTPHPVSDISRVCHITGDGVPEIPDGAAVYRNTATWSDWAVQASTLSVSSGVLRATATGNFFGIQNNHVCSAGNLIIMRVKSSKAGSFSILGNIGGNNNQILKSISIEAGILTTISFVAAPTTTAVDYTRFSTAVAGDFIDFYDIYIGTGAYASKVYDRAGQNHFTNTACLPVASPDGKGLLFDGVSSYAYAESPVIGTTGSIFIRFKMNGKLDLSTILFGNNVWDGSTGIRVQFNSYPTQAYIEIGQGGGVQRYSFPFINDLLWHTLIICIEETRLSVIVDTDPIYIISQGYTPPTIGAVAFRLGSNYNTPAALLFSGIISAFRYDSRIWTADEMMRMSIDPSGVDSQVKSAIPTPNAIQTFGPVGETYGQTVDGVKYATKILRGTTAGAQGGTAYAVHGLDVTKILKYGGSIFFTATETVPIGSPIPANNSYLDVDATNCNLRTVTGDSGNILSKPFVIFITYEI